MSVSTRSSSTPSSELTQTTATETVTLSRFPKPKQNIYTIEDYLRQLQEQYVDDGEEEGDHHYISIFEILDAPRELPDPIDLNHQHLKQISDELGLIKLCWPDLKHVTFEHRKHFPESYLKNNNKEKLLLLYTENFRRQFHHKFPHRKQIFLAAENECKLQKMVCTTIRPTKLAYEEIESYQECARFVGDHLKYEALDIPTLIPNRLYSPHTVFLRQSGTSYEIATALCSLLIGFGYNAFVVSGYATRDVTLKIMNRVDCPYPPEEEAPEVVEEVQEEQKYVVKPPKDLRSQFLLEMEQKEINKKLAEKQRLIDERNRLRAEEEIPPYDELEGLRVHGWVLLLPGMRDVEEPLFIEAATGGIYPTSYELYCGIESVWNNENYWINMQDCANGLVDMRYDLSVTEDWEHLLIGEPIYLRQSVIPQDMEKADIELMQILEEKHMDMPSPWSLQIYLPHHVLKKRYPDGIKVTMYKRTIVEEYAPYVMEDGLIVRVKRYDDIDYNDLLVVEEHYENRSDYRYKVIQDFKTDLVLEYFRPGREDALKKHSYYITDDTAEAERVIDLYSHARHDGLARVEIDHVQMTEYYENRDDGFYFRQVIYAKRGEPPPGMLEGPRRIVISVLEKFNRNENKPASSDIAVREFAVIDREIHLKYHYDTGKVTSSTRDFIKPPIAEMGDMMKFNPDLTFGYQAEIGAKPPRQLQLFQLFEEQLKEEEKSLHQVRVREDMVVDLLEVRASENSFPSLMVSLFNVEQNEHHRKGMLEREQQEREHREKEVEEEVDYLAPYIAKLGKPAYLNRSQAEQAYRECLTDFKRMLVNRANDIQLQFELSTQSMTEKQLWYSTNQDNLEPDAEERYFEELNDTIYSLHAMELRLARHRDLSPYRYEALDAYLKMDKRLAILFEKSDNAKNERY